MGKRKLKQNKLKEKKQELPLVAYILTGLIYGFIFFGISCIYYRDTFHEDYMNLIAVAVGFAVLMAAFKYRFHHSKLYKKLNGKV